MKHPTAGKKPLLGFLLSFLGVFPALAAPETEIAGALRTHLETPRPGGITVAGKPIHAAEALSRFYTARVYQPAWVDEPRLALPYDLVRALEESEREGLRPTDYHLERIKALLEKARAGAATPALLADLDLLLTDAFLIYGAHLVSGRVDPETFDPEWVAVQREVDMVELLGRALATRRPRDTLQDLLPAHPGYGRLRAALTTYRELAEWEEIPPALTPIEDDDPRIPALRRRLQATGDLAVDAVPQLSEEGAGELMDGVLLDAVRSFQRRHGLGDDAVVGTKTLRALNVPARERARQVELNLERWRWLPRDLGARHALVDIPAFTLQVFEGETEVLAMRAVVGRAYRRTPVWSDVIRYLVVNPFWEVPAKLAVQDKLPEIRKDPEYFAKNKFQVLQGWGSEEKEIDPATVDWNAVDGRKFPYRLRQAPGPLNALGRIKFMFPNRFNVYVHDTPTRELFKHPERAASSGCIRIEKPLELATYLLKATPGWGQEELSRVINSGETRTIALAEPFTIHLQYWTASVDGAGTVQFREDIYGRDTALAAALLLPPPGDPP